MRFFVCCLGTYCAIHFILSRHNLHQRATAGSWTTSLIQSNIIMTQISQIIVQFTHFLQTAAAMIQENILSQCQKWLKTVAQFPKHYVFLNMSTKCSIMQVPKMHEIFTNFSVYNRHKHLCFQSTSLVVMFAYPCLPDVHVYRNISMPENLCVNRYLHCILK